MSSSSSSRNHNIDGVSLPPSSCSEATSPFKRSLSDITDEDLELLVAQRVTSGAFSSWFVAIVIVYFDALEGQKVEELYPKTKGPPPLTPEELRIICYSAFPDSMSATIGDYSFAFRFRGTEALPFLYGQSYCRQRRDDSKKRGYYQKSVVFVSARPMFALMASVAVAVGPTYFEAGASWIEAILLDINKWPLPSSGTVLELPVAGAVVRAYSHAHWHNDAFLHAPAPDDICLATSLFGCLKHLHTLWQLVITGESIIVVGSAPTVVQAAVVALTSLIYPVLYCGDYRPYFTIHDAEAKTILREGCPPPPGLIVGCTNPFFLKLASAWPHLLCVGNGTGSECAQVTEPLSQSKMMGVGGVGGMSTPLFASKTKALIKMSKEVLRSAVGSRCSAAVIADAAAAVPPPASPSKLKAPVGGTAGAGAADAPSPRPPHLPPCNGGTLLRLHLAQLTSAFLQPFQPYLNTVATPGLPLPVLLPFRPSNFMQSLCADSLHSQFKEKGVTAVSVLYERFLATPHFSRWFFQRRCAVLTGALSGMLSAIPAHELQPLLEALGDVQLVELMLRLHGDLMPLECRGSPLEGDARRVMSLLVSLLPDMLEPHMRRQLGL